MHARAKQKWQIRKGKASKCTSKVESYFDGESEVGLFRSPKLRRLSVWWAIIIFRCTCLLSSARWICKVGPLRNSWRKVKKDNTVKPEARRNHWPYTNHERKMIERPDWRRRHIPDEKKRKRKKEPRLSALISPVRKLITPWKRPLRK